MNKVYAQFYMGQGGYLFSPGIPWLASKARAQGVEAETFSYGDAAYFDPKTNRCAAQDAIIKRAAQGYKIALIGYSLGCTSVTYLQQATNIGPNLHCDLVIALAMSELAQNYPINHARTRRSVLVHSNADFLSSAGENLGFDQLIESGLPHLLYNFAPSVTKVVLDELAKQQKS